MDHVLGGITVAILAADGIEQSGMAGARQALEAAGAICRIISCQQGQIRPEGQNAAAGQVDIDLQVSDADPDEYDGMLLPSGAASADQLRQEPQVLHLVRQMHERQKPLAALDHGVWLLIAAGVAQGRTLAGCADLQEDIRNAGGHWVEQEAVTDGNLITGRRQDDMAAFQRMLMDMLEARLTESARGTRDEDPSQVGIGS
jgi:protease I